MTRLVAIALLLAVACDDGAAPEPASAPEPAPPAEPDEPSRGACRPDASTTLIGSAPAAPAVAVAVSDSAALVAFPTAADRLALHPVAPSGAPDGPAREVEVPAAHGLLALRRTGERFVVVSYGQCEAGKCLFARLLARNGAAVGEVVRVPLEQPLLTRRIRVAQGAVLVARSQERGPPVLDRFEPTAEGLRHEAIPLGTVHPPGERRVEILGLAADGARWAVAWRAGATEAADSQVVLSTHEGEHEVEALHHALVLESFEWRDDALEAIAAFEYHRPRHVRLAAGGDAEAVREIPAGSTVPAPFADRRTATVRMDGARLLLELRDGAGDPLGEPVELARPAGRAVADVARASGGFLVAIGAVQEEGWSVRTVRVSCPG